MVQEQFKPRLHSPNPDHPTWAKCGRFTSGLVMAESDEEVTCGHCMRKLGQDPRKQLAEAVAQLVGVYEGFGAGELMASIQKVCNAWHAERNYISTRRYYR